MGPGPSQLLQGMGCVLMRRGRGRPLPGASAAHNHPRSLRSNGDVRSRHGADFSHFLGLLQGEFLIGCFFHLLFILFQHKKSVPLHAGPLHCHQPFLPGLCPYCLLHRGARQPAPVSALTHDLALITHSTRALRTLRVPFSTSVAWR